MRAPIWLRWSVLGVVLCGALLVGSRVFDHTPLSVTQRASALEATLKCPSCQDLSVAQSTSASSLAVRTFVFDHLNQGWSDGQIVSALEQRYGTAIMLVPPASGLGILLWLVPLALLMGLLGITIAFALRYRRRNSE